VDCGIIVLSFNVHAVLECVINLVKEKLKDGFPACKILYMEICFMFTDLTDAGQDTVVSTFGKMVASFVLIIY
jgi:hypothetical protein